MFLLNPNKPNGFSYPYTLYIVWVHLSFKECQVYFFIFVLSVIENPINKQWRPWSDAALCNVWSGSALFAYVPQKGHQVYLG